MNRPLYIASVDSYAGKSLTALALGLKLQADGLHVGYFKPLGTLPLIIGNITTDEDAHFIAAHLHPEAPLDAICPILLSPELTTRALQGEVTGVREQIAQAYQRVAADRDLVIVGGIGDLSRGSVLGLSAPAMAELLDARVILLARFMRDATIEVILLAHRLFGERCLGAIFNFVGPDDQEALKGPLGKHLEQRGLSILGILPPDEILAAVAVKDLIEHLPAKLLCCEKGLGNLIVHFVIGAMGVSSASKYFRQLSDKAVITGGDRADIQLAALQTATKAIVLTGNIYPSAVMIERAQQLGVPMLLSPYDTLTTVERIEQIQGRLRIRENVKIERAQALFEKHVNIEKIRSTLELSSLE